MSTPRIAITGWGTVSPLGVDADTTWAAMLAGASGVGRLEHDWADDLPVRIAGEVPAFEDRLSVREQRRMDRAEQLAMVAGREAWAMAGAQDLDRDRVAVVIGSAIGGLWTTIEQQHRLEASGPRRVSPHTVTMMMANGAAAWLSMDLGARAGARAPVSACASGSEAILNAREMILAGSADVVVAGGTDACITPLTLASLAILCWTTRLRSLLQLWLAVSLFLLLLDNLVTQTGAARGTVGWFAGRIEALISGVVVLCALSLIHI